MGTSSRSLASGLARDAGRWLATRLSLFLRIWVTALVTPGRCVTEYRLDRDQTRAVGYGVAVVAAWLAVGVTAGTVSHPVIGGMSTVSLVLWFALLGVLVVPVGLHLLAFVTTLVLIATVPERAPVSDTVQALAFGMSPAVLLAVPIVEVQAFVALYGSLALLYALRVVHGTSIWRAMLAGVLPAYLLFYVGFGAADATVEVLQAYYLI